MKDVFCRKCKKVHWVPHKFLYYMLLYTNGSEKLWMVTLGKQEDFSYQEAVQFKSRSSKFTHAMVLTLEQKKVQQSKTT